MLLLLHSAHLAVLLGVCSCESIPGLSFGDNHLKAFMGPENGVAEAESDFSRQISFCGWIQPNFSRWQTWIGILELRTTLTLGDRTPLLQLVVTSGNSGLAELQFMDVHKFSFTPGFSYVNLLRKWSAFCFSVDFQANEAQAALNGQVSALVKNPDTAPNFFGRFDGNKLEADQTGARYVFRLGRYYFDNNPLVGKLAAVSAWDSILSEDQMRIRTSCSSPVFEQGNLISARTTWTPTASLVSLIQVEEEELVCTKYKELVNAHLPIPELNRKEANDICNKFGSDVFMAGEINSKEDFDVYYQGLVDNKWYVSACGFSDNNRLKTWMPYVVNKTGTGLAHERSGLPLFGPYYAQWYPGPTGPDPTHVGAAYFGLVPKYENIDGDAPSAGKCTACALHNSHVKTSTVRLRGLCRYSLIDTEYQVKYSPDLGISYHGVERSNITYSREKSLWEIKDATDPSVSGFSEASFRSLSLGSFSWTIHNDTGCSLDPLNTTLTLTSCNVEEFTCGDGLCLPLDQRCDGQPQCGDSTDEIDCSVLELDQSYNKFLSPPSSSPGSRLGVNVSINIIALGSFDPIQSNYETKFILSLEWLDRRLRFNNLRLPPTANRVDTESTGKLWFPAFVFDNTKDKNESVLDNKATVQVVRRGLGQHNGQESQENKVVFTGDSNSILYSRYYNQIFECVYDFKWYPFDTQSCNVVLLPVKSLRESVQLLPSKFEYSGPMDLTQFTIKKIVMVEKLEEGSVAVEVTIQRRLLSIILTTFLPTLIVNIVGHMSNYFKEFFFEGLISTNVTVLLVITTLFISVSESLPTTAYIKMIDVWLIFNLLKPFIDIIVQTYIESLREAEQDKDEVALSEKQAWVEEEATENEQKLRSKDEKKQQKAMNSFYEKAAKKNEKKIRFWKTFARRIYPIFCITFIILFWVLGMVVYNKDS